MQYLDQIYWAFIVVWFVEFYLFGIQRAALLISRNSDVDYKSIGKCLLPSWYPITWLIIILKWCLLILIFWLAGWEIGLTIFIISFVLTVVIPIPYRKLYTGIFYKRVKQITTLDSETGALLSEILSNADF